MFDILSKDFKSAPFWQKVILIVLLGILFFHIFVRSGVTLFSQKLHKLETEREALTKQLQMMQYLIADQKVIEKNQERESKLLAAKLLAQSEVESAIRKTFAGLSRKVISGEFAAVPDRVYLLFSRSTCRFQAVVLPQNLTKILAALDQLPGVDIKSIDYQNSILNIELWYFYRKGGAAKNNSVSSKNVSATKRQKKQVQPGQNLVQGFYTNQQVRQTIINGRLFRVGDKCGKYTIIGIDPEQKIVRVRANGRIRTIKSGEWF